MRLSQIEGRQLERWATGQLDDIGAANPSVLAKLIVSLVNEDKGTQELKKHCTKDLKVFLKDGAEDFVEFLFDALEDGSYQVALDDANDEDRDDYQDEDDSSRSRNRNNSPPPSDDEDERRPRGGDRFRRDSMDNADNQGPAVVVNAPSSSTGQAQAPRGPAQAYSKPGEDRSQAKYNPAPAGQFDRNARQPYGQQPRPAYSQQPRGAPSQFHQGPQGQSYPRGGAGRGGFNHNHGQSQGFVQGYGQFPLQQQGGYPRGAPRGAPRGPPQINDTASYNPYATPILPQMYPQFVPAPDPSLIQNAPAPVLYGYGGWTMPPTLHVPSNFQTQNGDAPVQVFSQDGFSNPGVNVMVPNDNMYHPQVQNVVVHEPQQQFIPQHQQIEGPSVGSKRGFEDTNQPQSQPQQAFYPAPYPQQDDQNYGQSHLFAQNHGHGLSQEQNQGQGDQQFVQQQGLNAAAPSFVPSIPSTVPTQVHVSALGPAPPAYGNAGPGQQEQGAYGVYTGGFSGPHGPSQWQDQQQGSGGAPPPYNAPVPGGDAFQQNHVVYAAPYGNSTYSQQPPAPFGTGNNATNFNGKGGRERGAFLQEHERCTLRCTGLPAYLTEDALRTAFEEFGHVVSVKLIPADTENNTGGKRSYNECLVQYYSASNAKKRLHDQRSLFDNRFIIIKPVFINLIPPNEVPPPPAEVLDRDAAIVLHGPQRSPRAQTQGYQGGQQGTGYLGKKPFQSQGQGFNMYNPGVSNKYRRTDDADNRVHTSSHTLEVTSSSTEALEVDANGDFPSVSDVTATTSVVPAASIAVEAPNPQRTDALTGRVSNFLVSAQDAASSADPFKTKETLDSLKTLRQQAEELSKKKESILMAQIEKCRQMVDQLEQGEDSESGRAMLQNLEAKILALQTQLRTVREQQTERQNETANPGAAAAGSYHQPQQAYQGQGYAGRGGRGRGRFANSYQGSYANGGRGSYRGGAGRFQGRGRGRGRGGRGDPAFYGSGEADFSVGGEDDGHYDGTEGSGEGVYQEVHQG